MMLPFEIIDISQPVSSSSAYFPGDVPFSRDITLTHQDSGVINLCAFTMSPHVGTHADAPVHVGGALPEPNKQDTNQPFTTAGELPLEPFIGPVAVIDVSPCTGAVQWEQVKNHLETYPTFPQRVLFKTVSTIQYDTFESAYPWLSVGLIERLAERGVKLVGLDTPSVDAIDSKALETHHALLKANMVWLENLDLSQVQVSTSQPELFFLSAVPLKFMELEASPVRAVLLRFKDNLPS